MARAALRWGVRKLSTEANVGKTTIVRFEGDLSMPIPSTLAALRRAFEEAGIEFIEDWGVGLRATPATADSEPIHNDQRKNK
jgi:hypothetical protein